MMLNKFARFLFTKEQQGLNNLYTGYKLSRGANWTIAGVSAGITGGVIGFNQAKVNMGIDAETERRAAGPIAYRGNIPEYGYDGNPNINQSTGKYDLGASGDMVFAMSRKGR